jgi:drug/metabolite transporter superfamily protein YnfA
MLVLKAFCLFVATAFLEILGCCLPYVSGMSIIVWGGWRGRDG